MKLLPLQANVYSPRLTFPKKGNQEKAFATVEQNKDIFFSGSRNNRLRKACETADLEKMRLALENGGNPNAGSDEKPAHIVVKSESKNIPQALKLLADYNANLNN